MKKRNIVFIATSLDGYIASEDGSIDWLHSIPNPDNDDLGFAQLMNDVDAIVMGRTTYETVLGFDIEWPYSKHVFVLSTTLSEEPDTLTDKVTLLKGSPTEVLDSIHQRGYQSLYIDGGRTVQEFLASDLIDELRITTIPILLGGGFPLFGKMNNALKFELKQSLVYLNQLVQNHYVRIK